MLRAAFRNRLSKGPDNCDQGNNNASSDSEDEYHDLKMEFSKDTDLLDEADVHIIEKSDESSAVTKGKDSEKFFEDSLSKSEATAANDNSSKRERTSAEEETNFPEREIYEMQLLQLQEQLVATIISEQEKDTQLKKYQELDIEKLQKNLKEEQEKNAELADKVKILKNKMQNYKLARTNASKSDPRKQSNRSSKNLENELFQGEEWVNVSAEMNAEGGKEKSDDQDVQSSPSESSLHPEVELDVASCAPELPRTMSVKDKPDGTSKPAARYSAVYDYKKRIIEMIVDRLWDFVNEETDTATEDDEDDDALSVKKLKENINRFSNGIKPITNFIKCVYNLISWTNIAATSLAFLVYMYTARHGYLFSLFLLMVIWKFFMNYLSARGIAAQIGLEVKEKEEVTDDKSLSDKFQLVLEVAKKVQNTLGKMADSLEKIKNLLMWQHPATNKLFLNICLLFIASLLFSGPTLFMFMALGFGIKTFVTGPLYAKFPKVKKRYDGVASIWSELPTDAVLATREEYARESRNRTLTAGQNSTDASTSNGLQHNASHTWINFCEKVKIPSSEKPLPSWEEGHRCTLINKDRPLTNMKNGRLYLTQNYLCFERNKSSKHVTIKLENITSASKYKPIHIMPGTGMAIEVEVKGSSKPYVFAALLGRDELYESLIMTGRAANYRWAC